jgi:tetratricopeptide (TPR) repeat protein
VTSNDPRSEVLELLKGGHFEETIGLGYLWDRTEFNRAFLKASSRWSADAEVRTELNKARNVLLGENDRQKGIRLFGFREFDVAREYFQRAASESGDGLDYQWLGRTLLELGQTEAAIQQFTNAVKTDGSANNLLWLGSALVNVDLRKDALVHFARAVEMRGDAVDHYWYGKTLTELGRPRKAVRSLRLAVSGRGSPEDISWLGRALAAAGSKKKALAELSKAVSLRGWAEDCYWLGRTLAELKRGVDALPHLRKAVSARGEPEDIHWLGRALFQAGLKEEAITYFEQAIESRGNCADHHWLGTALLDAENCSEALSHLEKAIELRGDGADHYFAGIAMEKLGRRVDAYIHFKTAVDKRGDAADYFELGKCLYGLKVPDEALLMFQHARESRSDPLYSHWVGRVLLESGSSQEAFPLLEEAFRQRNAAIDLLLLKRCLKQNLAEATQLSQSGNLLGAERLFRRTTEAIWGVEELADQASEARSGWQSVRHQLQRFKTFDDSLQIFERRDLSSAIAAPPAGGTEVQTGELSEISGCEWLEATLPDGSVGFILVSNARGASEMPSKAAEPEVVAINATQEASLGESVQREAVPKPHTDNPPYAQFTAWLVSSSLLASVSVFEMADATTRGQWDNTAVAVIALLVAAVLARSAQMAWRRIVAAEGEDDAMLKRRQRRIIVTSFLIAMVLFTGAAIVGSAIGQNRAEAAQLTADFKRMIDIGERVSKARSAADSTIASYVQMYEDIEPDVQELESTLRQLKTELALYDTKFPAQHDDTSKSLAGIEQGLRRAMILKQQIELAKQIKTLQSSQQIDVWKKEMLPLLSKEEDLDKAK